VGLGGMDSGTAGRQRLRDVVESNRCRHCAYRTTTGARIRPRRNQFKLLPRGAPSIVNSMNEPAARSAVDVELRRIERRLDELVATVNQLKEENRALRQRQDTLIGERANLLQKNEQVRARVEAMIGRLKAMEQG
jgi:cell division protein ZapB